MAMSRSARVGACPMRRRGASTATIPPGQSESQSLRQPHFPIPRAVRETLELGTELPSPSRALLPYGTGLWTPLHSHADQLVFFGSMTVDTDPLSQVCGNELQYERLGAS